MPFFEWTPALWIGVPVVALLVATFVWQHRDAERKQLITIAALRSLTLVVLALLVARPIFSSQQGNDPPRNQIVFLLDRSESMALEDQGKRQRYRAALDMFRNQWIAAAERQQLEVKASLFAEQAVAVRGDALLDAKPDGKQTNLPKAILQSLTEGGETPLAIVALTDGISTEDLDRHAAAAALLENGVPLVGIGFGSETGPKVLSLQAVTAPTRVAPTFEFRIEAALQAIGQGHFPAFELALLRDGKLVDSRKIKSFDKPRMWQESFRVQEQQPGKYQYTLRVLPPNDPLIRCSNREGNALVRVADEEQWRVLFIQGGLTWDFKFIQLAVKQDPSMQITGLSRTASGSRFFQNVDDESQLVGGFPANLDALGAYRVVVLANLKPADLGAPQQEMLVRYCDELGGGVLLLGGSETFNLAWRGSALEQLLPVRFSGSRPGTAAAPFRVQPSDDALRSPVFQISDRGAPRTAWDQLPQFTEYAHVQSLKPGATVWLHRGDTREPLMAVQRFGAGRTAAICVPNLWRWRLAKDSQVETYDRFWQQLFRYLGGGDAQPVAIHLADQLLMPQVEIHATLSQRPVAGDSQSQRFRFVVEDSNHKKVTEQQVELTPGKSTDVVFQAAEAGLYTLRVLDTEGVEQGNRVVELKNLEREFAVTVRDMETLKQWAQLSSGVAMAAEDCNDVDEIISTIKQRAKQVYQRRPTSKPAGMNGWMLIGLLALLSTEWILRRRWSWT